MSYNTDIVASLLLGVCFLAIWFFFFSSNKHSNKKGTISQLPGPETKDLASQIAKQGMKGFVEMLHNKYDSDVIQFYLSPENHVISVRDPKILNSLLKVGSRPKFLFQFLEPIIGKDNFQVEDGENAKKARKMFNQNLTHHSLSANYETLMQDVNEKLEKFRELSQEKPFVYEMQSEMLDVFLKLGVRTFVGKNVPMEKLVDLSLYRQSFFNVIALSFQQQYGKLSDWEIETFSKSLDYIDRATDRLVQYVREHKSIEDDDRKTLLSVLTFENDYKTGEPFTKEKVYSHLKGYLMAAYHTIVVGLSWTLFALTQHSDVLKKARKEIDELALDYPNDSQEKFYPTFKMLDLMTYTTQVINESLRLFTPGKLFRVFM